LKPDRSNVVALNYRQCGKGLQPAGDAEPLTGSYGELQAFGQAGNGCRQIQTRETDPADASQATCNLSSCADLPE
jgi:hypothetical protein